MILARGRYGGVYAFNKYAPRRSIGVAVKVYGTPWGRRLTRQASVGLFLPNEKKGRGCFTVEAVTWKAQTHKETGRTKRRVGLKTFVRLKVGIGG